MVDKTGKYPCNARVDVDYSGKKPKVNFSYPDKNPKKDAIKQGGNIYVYFFLIMVLILIPYTIFITHSEVHEYPSNCSVDFENHTEKNIITGQFYEDGKLQNHSYNITTKDKWTEAFNITCGNETWMYKFNRNEYYSEESRFFYDDGKLWDKKTRNLIYLVGYVIFMWIFILSFLQRWVNRLLIKLKWYRNWIPKHNAKGIFGIGKGKRYYYKFKPKDVFENVVIIPKFGNVILDYKTKGDFKDKLEKIRIREYNWKEKKGKKISKKKQDKFKWYAIFTFRDKPKNGYLEVEYK